MLGWLAGCASWYRWQVQCRWQVTMAGAVWGDGFKVGWKGEGLAVASLYFINYRASRSISARGCCDVLDCWRPHLPPSTSAPSLMSLLTLLLHRAAQEEAAAAGGTGFAAFRGGQFKSQVGGRFGSER